MRREKKFSVEQQKYQKYVEKAAPKRPVIKNCIKAFIVGGAICTLGQGIQWVFINFFHFSEKTAGNPTTAILIIISAFLTGIGVYDFIGQFAGAGTAIPVTGFANAITSAAIEHRSEGLVLGTAGNMFRIAGCVIVYGVFSAFVITIIRMSLIWLGVM